MSGDLFRSLFIDPYDSPAAGTPSGTGMEGGGFPAAEGTVAGEGDPLFGDTEGLTIPQQIRKVGEQEQERVGMWQVHNKYIITQIRSGIMIVDQHVAHERILYELALKNMESAMPMSQQLLFPLEMKLSPAEYAQVRELRNDLAALGFELSLEGGDTAVIHGVPNDVRPGQEGGILRELLDQYREYQQMGKTDQQEMLAASANLEFEKAALMRDQIADLKAGTGLDKLEPRRRPINYKDFKPRKTRRTKARA